MSLKKALDYFKKGQAIFEAHGRPSVYAVWLDTFITGGNLAAQNFLKNSQRQIEDDPDYPIKRNIEIENLPPCPTLDLAFGFDAARDFLTDEIFPILFGRREDGKAKKEKYGEANIHRKPVWWHLDWKPIAHANNKRDDLVQLIMNMYEHYGIYVDKSSLQWRRDIDSKSI